jgi:hypothetical protein
MAKPDERESSATLAQRVMPAQKERRVKPERRVLSVW